jgi:hypothetical protein
MGKYFSFFESVIINPQRSFKLLTGVLHVVIQAILCYEKKLIQIFHPNGKQNSPRPHPMPTTKKQKINNNNRERERERERENMNKKMQKFIEKEIAP